MNVENVVNDLVGYKNLKIYQCNKYFNFSLDSVILPNFITIDSSIKKIIDLGCGNAPIPLILTTKTAAKIIGIEIQKEIYDLAIKSVEINNLSNQIEIKNADIKDIIPKKLFQPESVDIVLSNPPYFKKIKTSILNENEVKTNARHETLVTLEEIIKTSSYLLKNKGRIGIVHRTERLPEIICLMKKYRLEPKIIRFVFPKENSESNLVLVEGSKNANEGLKVIKPLIVHDEKGNYTKEILKMFE